MSKSNPLKKRIFAAIVAGTMVMSISLAGCNNNKSSSDSSSKGSSSETTSQSSITSSLGGDTVVKSTNYKISFPIMNYLFNYNYQTYLSRYGQYLSYYGFDSSKSLKEQYYDESNKETWYDYFLNLTKQNIEQTLVLAEAAKADKITLDDNDLATVKSSISSLESAASSNSKSTKDYIESYCGEGVTEDAIKSFLELTALFEKYYNKIYDSFKYSEADYENYYNKNKTTYQYVDLLEYTFSADTSSDASEADKKDAQDKAKAYAEALSKCKTEDEFKAYVKKYLTDNPKVAQQYVSQSTSTSSSSSSSESSITEEDLEKAIETGVTSTENKKYAYEVTSDIGKWAFNDTRKANDTTIIQKQTDSTQTSQTSDTSASTAYTAVILLKPSYRDESINKNVRHILLTSTTYGSDEKAKAKAEEIYKKWKSGKATEDSFAELAKKYSSDTGSASSGGLYENVEKGKMVTEFNDWCFDSSRKAGDTGIIKTQYGYHIMYFVGNSKPAWEESVDQALRKSDFNDKYTELKKKYTVQFDDDYLKKVDLLSSDETSGSTSTASSAASSSASTESTAEASKEESSKSN